MKRKECKTCEFWIDEKKCTVNIGEEEVPEIECYLKILVWLLISINIGINNIGISEEQKQIMRKAFQFIEKYNEEMDEGEEWKH